MKVLLKGGVGNQLFQITAARYLAAKNLNIQIIEYDSRWPDATSRNHSHDLRYRLLLHKNERWSETKTRHGNLLSLASLRATEMLFPPEWNQSSRFGQIKRFGLTEDNLLEPGDFYKISGFFQDWRYLQFLKDAGLGIQLTPSGRFDHSTLGDFAALHIRGGDYLGLSNSFGLLSFEYFRSAMKLIPNDLPIVVFTDDLERSHALIRDLRLSDSHVFGPKDLTPIEVLEIYGKARASIISNSTFSWWATELSESIQVKVMPQTWFRSLSGPSLKSMDWLTVESCWE